jgi:hypothetical protein
MPHLYLLQRNIRAAVIPLGSSGIVVVEGSLGGCETRSYTRRSLESGHPGE